MSNTSGRASVIHGKATTALKLACLPAVLLLANCNAPPAPQAPATTTVIERPQIVERPAITVDLGAHDDDRRRHDDDQRRRDEEQRQHDEHQHDDRPH